MMQRLKNRDNTKGMRRVNCFEESEEDTEEDEVEKQLVLRVEGDSYKPCYMEGMMCGNYFEAIIDNGSREVFNFTKRDLQKILGDRKVVIRDMIRANASLITTKNH